MSTDQGSSSFPPQPSMLLLATVRQSAAEHYSNPSNASLPLLSQAHRGAGVALLRYDRRSFRIPRSRMLGKRQVDAGDLDDGLPRGFLTGAIVEVWVALRLNWACELPLSRGEELP